MRAYGRRKVLALAVGLLAGAVACSGTPSGAPTPQAAGVTRDPVSASPTPSPSPTAPPITPEEAREVFTAFTAADNVLRVAAARGYSTLKPEGDLTRDGQKELTAAAFTASGDRPPQRVWGEPELLVPRFLPEEKAPWFSVLVPRDGRPTFLVFAKSGERWYLGSAAELQRGATMPEVEVDALGYATLVPSDDKSVLIGPKLMAPLHATVAEAGKKGVAADLLADGPYTTEIAARIAADRSEWKRGGYFYNPIMSASEYPVYALRTKDGGAFVQYTLTRNITVEPRIGSAVSDGIPVPDAARWAIKKDRLFFSLKMSEIHQYATSIPPASSKSRAVVIAHDGGMIRAFGK
ncbi:hypothetical protein [Nonomuraea typhae]|uniref:DUF8094 domain-containing protein n=1 Tax=Nonomuraea typhae TaxID=2603600 RepID=A0ABW7Z0F3_9ACTN